MNAVERPWSRWLWLVLGVAILERVALWLAYPPVIFDDSRSYRRLAEQVLGAAPLDGTRSPGYPYFLAWLGPDRNVYAVQLLLGLLTTLLFFYIGWLISDRASIGAVAALLHTLNLGQLLFEADLLAETLTTFFVMVTLCAGVWLLKQPLKWGPKQFGAAVLVGVAGGLASLARPQFVFLPFFVAFVLVFDVVRKSLQNLHHEEHERKPLNLKPLGLRGKNALLANKKLWALVFVIILPAIFLNGLWVNYIHNQFGVWSMSSDDGYHIIQHTGKFFEYVPDEYAVIRDTFLKYRAIQIANTGKASNTIWAAIPELQKVSGLGFYKLSHKLRDISIDLIRAHPLLYAGSVAEAWAWFWSAPFYWDPQGFGGAAAVFAGLAQLQRFLLWAANAIFVVGTLALIFPRIRQVLAMPAAIWLFLGAVWANSILQAIVEASENPRYSVSTQTLVVLVVAWWLWQMILWWKGRYAQAR